MCSIDADKFSLPITGIIHVENMSLTFSLNYKNKTKQKRLVWLV